MAEPTVKRQREEDGEDFKVEVKRQKSYEDIFSILEEDEDEPTEDLSSLITSFEQEITSPEEGSAINGASSTSETDPSTEEDDVCGRVMRHLLEASDDELGLPSSSAAEESFAGDLLLPPVSGVGGGDGLWEIEDEAANYYTLLQSELFM